MRIILGAGCSGLSLARALREAGDDRPLVLVDRRSSFGADRTWCFWQAGPSLPGASSASHRWHRWQFVGAGGEVVRQGSARHPYCQVRSEDFYSDSLAALDRAGGVEVRLGQRILGARRLPDGTTLVRTSSGELIGDEAFDAMGGLGPWDAGRPPGKVELRQSFLGLEIEASRAAFDPGVATLMDFRTGPAGDGGLHFVYVLPTSTTRALVEHTTLGRGLVSPDGRRAAIGAYLAAHWGVREFAVVREERGVLPMSTHRFAPVHGPGLRCVGAAAGAVRPSSGYAFVRIQHHARALARSVVDGTEAPRRVGSGRHAALDGLFLRALAADPPAFESNLLALARHTRGDVFARFMSDASSPADEAAVVGALARPGFVWPILASQLGVSPRPFWMPRRPLRSGTGAS